MYMHRSVNKISNSIDHINFDIPVFLAKRKISSLDIPELQELFNLNSILYFGDLKPYMLEDYLKISYSKASTAALYLGFYGVEFYSCKFSSLSKDKYGALKIIKSPRSNKVLDAFDRPYLFLADSSHRSARAILYNFLDDVELKSSYLLDGIVINALSKSAKIPPDVITDILQLSFYSDSEIEHIYESGFVPQYQSKKQTYNISTLRTDPVKVQPKIAFNPKKQIKTVKKDVYSPAEKKFLVDSLLQNNLLSQYIADQLKKRGIMNLAKFINLSHAGLKLVTGLSHEYVNELCNSIKHIKATQSAKIQNNVRNQDNILKNSKAKNWSLQECAYLIIAIEDVYLGKVQRNIAIQELSQKLRKMAISTGEKIDEVYRNEAGISLQMAKMEYLLTKGRKGLSSASSYAFNLVCSQYRNDIENFNKLYQVNATGVFNGDITKYLNSTEETGEASEEYIANPKENNAVVDEIPVIDDNDPQTTDVEVVDKGQRENVVSVTGSKVVAFDIDKDFVEVFGWSGLYASLFNLMIKKYKQHKPYPQTIVASFTKGEKRGRWTRLKNGLFLNVNYSAIAVIQRITELLDCYGISADKCTIYLKNDLGSTAKIKLSDCGKNAVSFNQDKQSTTNTDIMDKYSDLSAKIKTTLSEKYKKGFRLDSHIEKQRFKIFYEQLNGETIPDNIPETIIEQLIKRNGINYENIVYVPDNMLDQETRDDLLSYIDSSFENGRDVIYFTALYDEFSEKFLTQSILNADMLKEYLSYINSGNYYIFKEYIAKDKEAKNSIKQEIINLYLDRPEPFSPTDVYSSLPHIDKSKILQELRTSSDFISNGREQYFLADNFNISEEDIAKLKELIENLLDASATRFITAAEMMDLIHNRMPSLFENNGFLSELGIRNVISQILKSDFCFNSNVISDKNSNIELNDVFEDFARSNPKFSLKELKNLASDFSSGIYFDAINKYSMRIDKDEFISKDQLNFDTKEVDYAISLFCLDDYTPIQSITNFASFPVISYKWTPFLLESYLLNYSNEFELFNHGLCETKVVGAVVKRKCQFNSLYDVLVDAVAKSKCKLEKDDVLEFLCEQDYIARRKYSLINSIIEKARIIRNLKG